MGGPCEGHSRMMNKERLNRKSEIAPLSAEQKADRN